MAKKKFPALAFCASSAATLLLLTGADAREAQPLLPAEVVSQVLDEAEGPSLDRLARRRLLQRLADDPRAAIRIQAADVTGNLNGAADAVFAQGLLRTLSADTHSGVRMAAARALAQRLRRLPSVSAMSCAAEWAISSKSAHRECVAQAMVSTDESVWNEHLLEQLMADVTPSVRAAATRALSGRYHSDPNRYGWLLSAALTDTDVKVRRLAQRVAAGRTA